MTAAFGAEAADAVVDVMGGDVNELLMVRDTVSWATGAPGRTFQQWATENTTAFL